MDKIYPELADYIFEYYRQFFLETERKALNHHAGKLKFGNRPNLHPELIKVRDQHLTNDTEALKLLDKGYKTFVINTANRIYEQHKDDLDLNLCPKCDKIARTPNAKQCRFCSNSWH